MRPDHRPREHSQRSALCFRKRKQAFEHAKLWCRTNLNLPTHLSGIATATRAWADALSGSGCAVRDTRKTTPGLRQLEKYAVRCGGGLNHRMGLGDAALIKDNHVVAAGSVTKAIEAVRAVAPALPLEVECDDLTQVEEALAARASSSCSTTWTWPIFGPPSAWPGPTHQCAWRPAAVCAWLRHGP